MKCQIYIETYGINFREDENAETYLQNEIYFTYEELRGITYVHVPEISLQQYAYNTISRRLKLRI